MGILVAWGVTQDPWVRILVNVLFTSLLSFGEICYRAGNDPR